MLPALRAQLGALPLIDTTWIEQRYRMGLEGPRAPGYVASAGLHIPHPSFRAWGSATVPRARPIGPTCVWFGGGHTDNRGLNL